MLSFIACNVEKVKISHPTTEKVTQIDTLWGEITPDPYRWLEDDMSEETKKWVITQNQFSEKVIAQCKEQNKIEKVLKSLWDYEKYSVPYLVGNDIYYYKNTGLQNHSVLYKKSEKGKDVVFLDPNTFSKDGSVSVSGVSFSHEESSKYVGYQISDGGADWKTIVIKDIKKDTEIDKVENVKFSGIAWKKSEGFFYSTYKTYEGKSKLSSKTEFHELFYHKIGAKSQDKPIFGGEKNKKRYVWGETTKDNAYLFIYASNSTTGNQLYFMNLENGKNTVLPIDTNEETETEYIQHDDEYFYFLTNANAPNRKLIRVSKKEPSLTSAEEIIPNGDTPLKSVTPVGGKFLATYIKDIESNLILFDADGKNKTDIQLSGNGIVNSISGDWEKDLFFYSFTNYITPTSILKYSLSENKSEKYQSPKVQFDSKKYVSKKVFYSSKDGTKIPMHIIHKKDLKMNGNTPTFLYAYGGFNISILPSFRSTIATWLELGGIYAVPNLRGGGEYGDEWHNAGIKMKKQNVFDDFIAAGEYLIEKKYTSSEKLAVHGRSNGGLLVGAVMTQRPDLMKVAIPSVGVLDMLRYHKFTSGAGWIYDFGNADESKEMFEYLKGYSPLHSLKKTNYPATIVTTGDHDDRVVPAHSFKFGATLQENQTGNLPIIIRIDTKAGHGSGKSTEMLIKEWADIYAFTWHYLQ